MVVSVSGRKPGEGRGRGQAPCAHDLAYIWCCRCGGGGCYVGGLSGVSFRATRGDPSCLSESSSSTLRLPIDHHLPLPFPSRLLIVVIPAP